MISLAITSFERSGFTVESFIEVLNNEFIDDIAVVDDHSCSNTYRNLQCIIDILRSPKIHLYRNDANVGPCCNKTRAVAKCRNDWVILFDSDNVINNSYINMAVTMSKTDNVLYCPETLLDIQWSIEQWGFKEFSGINVGSENINNYVDNINFQTLLNAGNNFFHKKTFFNAIKGKDEEWGDIGSGDSMYLVYLWLKNKGRIQVVSNLKYGHRIHDKSFYVTHRDQGINFNYKTLQKIKALCTIGI